MSFDEKAKNWDSEERIIRGKIIASEINKNISNNTQNTAMEFGCGTGLISFNLVDKFNKITLVDTSTGMINVLNEKIKQYNIKHMTPYLLDLSNDDFNVKHNVIYTSMVLHHVTNVKKILNKLFNLIQDGGELCIVDLDKEDGTFHDDDINFKGHNGFNQVDLKNTLEKIGFKDIHSYTFYHGKKIKQDKKIDYSLFIMTAKKY